MSELYFERFNTHAFKKGMRRDAKLSPYQGAKASKDLKAADEMASPGQYKKKSFRRTSTSKRWGW